MEKTPFIEIRGLRKVYKLGKERVVALDDINLTIQRGEICCILGTSGSCHRIEPCSHFKI